MKNNFLSYFIIISTIAFLGLIYFIDYKNDLSKQIKQLKITSDIHELQNGRLGKIIDVTEMGGKTILAIKFKKKIIMIRDENETILPFEQEYSIFIDSNSYGKGYYLVSENAKVKCSVIGYKLVKE